jgi:hypothetical protein
LLARQRQPSKPVKYRARLAADARMSYHQTWAGLVLESYPAQRSELLGGLRHDSFWNCNYKNEAFDHRKNFRFSQ